MAFILASWVLSELIYSPVDATTFRSGLYAFTNFEINFQAIKTDKISSKAAVPTVRPRAEINVIKWMAWVLFLPTK